MRRATVAGRLASVQTAVTVVTLGLVVLGTSFAVTTLLARKTDRGLQETAERVATLVEGFHPETLELEWENTEIEEWRPRGMRIEVHELSGRPRALAGEGADLYVNETGCSDQGTVRVCGMRAGSFLVLTGVDRSLDIRARNGLIYTLAAVTALAAGLVALTSRRIARRALRPLSDLATRVATIEPGAGQRVGLHSGLEELELLEGRFDQFVERVEEALARERRLTAQASHELRTPLTVARAEIEALAPAGSDPEALKRALAAVDRLSELVEALLWFARAQERLDDEAVALVNMADVIRAQLAELARVTPDRPVVARLPDETLVRGDERLLGRITANLLDNALKYGERGPVDISAGVEGDVLSVRVTNRGALPEDVRERLFEPFFRGSRTQAVVKGFGLGLPFARAVARTHGGDVVLGSGDPKRTEFVLTLPIVAWSDESSAAEGAV
jgi:signal transduction histidine kinase